MTKKSPKPSVIREWAHTFEGWLAAESASASTRRMVRVHWGRSPRIRAWRFAALEYVDTGSTGMLADAFRSHGPAPETFGDFLAKVLEGKHLRRTGPRNTLTSKILTLSRDHLLAARRQSLIDLRHEFERPGGVDDDRPCETEGLRVPTSEAIEYIRAACNDALLGDLLYQATLAEFLREPLAKTLREYEIGVSDARKPIRTTDAQHISSIYAVFLEGRAKMIELGLVTLEPNEARLLEIDGLCEYDSDDDYADG